MHSVVLSSVLCSMATPAAIRTNGLEEPIHVQNYLQTQANPKIVLRYM